jgi:hypothetical protein
MKIEPVKPFVVVLYISDEENDAYGHPWYKLVKSVRKDCDYLDLDQSSEKPLLDNIKKAIDESNPFILMADVINFTETPPGLGMIADAMLRHSKHCYAVLKGDHELIKKWLTPLGEHLTIYTDEDELEKKLQKLLNQDSQD